MRDYETDDNRSGKRAGIIAVMIYAALLSLLFVMLQFDTRQEYNEGGMLIDFGTTEDGAGARKASPANHTNKENTAGSNNNQKPVPVERTAARPTPAQNSPAEQTAATAPAKAAHSKPVQTQDFEDAPKAPPQPPKEPPKTPKPKPQDPKPDKPRTSDRSKPQPQPSVPAKPQPSATQPEQKPTASQSDEQPTASQPKEEKPREVNKNALFPGRNSDSEAASHGSGNAAGNRGNPFGGNDGGKSGTEGNGGKSGAGSAGAGHSINLKGRELVGVFPEPTQTGHNKYGKVIIEITVDSGGNVMTAQYIANGSTTQDAELVAASKRAALKAKFTPDEKNPLQVGAITYIFKPDYQQR